MADMTPHYCAACGEMHGGSTGTDPAIKIAQINADRDVRVAELNQRSMTSTAEELESRAEVAQIEADAAVGAAEAIGPISPPPVEPPEPVEPEPVSVEDVIEDMPGEPEPPEVMSSPTPREPKKKSWWGAYS